MRKMSFIYKASPIFISILVVLLFVQSNNPTALTSSRQCYSGSGNVYNPAIDIKELFHDVQLSGTYPDSKTFVDCTPSIAIDSINYYYAKYKNQPSFQLNSFISRYFTSPVNMNFEGSSNEESNLNHHLMLLWDKLVRKPDSGINGTLIPLSYPYIVPGGRFREIYYWDSYFTMLGLAASNRNDLIKSMLDNFACLIDEYGYIPNGNRTYYLGRSQPPFFAEMVKLFMHETADSAGLQYLLALEAEYKFWMEPLRLRKLNAENGYLNHYSDNNSAPRPEAYKEDFNLGMTVEESKRNMVYSNIRAACESGWDFSSRWLADGSGLASINTIDILPVDLNCLIYNLEATIAELYKMQGNTAFSSVYYKKANDRKQIIQKLFWNKKKGFFYDFNYKTNKQTKVESLAALYPLYFKIATPEMAAKVAERIKADFLKDGGLITTTNITGQQWDAPNGWAPLQWIAVVGLENYGMNELADSIAHRWLSINEKVYVNTGKMMEKYNVVNTSLDAGGGEYPGQDGFGWTNGVYLALLKKGYK